jgi:hypothetical protein
MAVRDKLLANEQIVFESEKHWMAPIRDSAIPALLVIAGLGLGWLAPDKDGGILGFAGNVLDFIKVGLWIVAVGWIIYNIVLWRTASFAVTNQRVLREEGLVSKRSSATLLGSVTDVKTTVPFLGARLGYGDLVVLTQSGSAGQDKFETITHPVEFRDQIMTRKISGGGAPTAASPATAAPAAAPAAASAPAPAPASAAPVAPAQPASADQLKTIADLAALRDSGAITPEEFEQKKTEILSRI